MVNPWNLEDLEIVGYADSLKENMLPSVVPPVFRMKADHGRALLPPYHINGSFLWNATEVSASELQNLSGSREITLFEPAFPARTGHELWVDDSFQCRYQPQYEAEEQLGRIATEAIQGAKDALRREDIEQAEHLSGVAACADDRRVAPLVIKAAICRWRSDAARERLMAELAAPFVDERLFRNLVDDYCALLPYCRATPMRNMACMRAFAA